MRIVVVIAEWIRCHRQDFCRYSRVDQMSLSELLLALQNGSDVTVSIVVGTADWIRCHCQDFCRHRRVDQIPLSGLLLVLQN